MRNKSYLILRDPNSLHVEGNKVLDSTRPWQLILHGAKLILCGRHVMTSQGRSTLERIRISKSKMSNCVGRVSLRTRPRKPSPMSKLVMQDYGPLQIRCTKDVMGSDWGPASRPCRQSSMSQVDLLRRNADRTGGG